MRTVARAIVFVLALPLCAAAAGAAECVPFTRALEKVGESACITGKIVEVRVARGGTTYLNFCREQRDCGFAVAVAPADARRFGNLAVLKNREIRITGKVFRREHRAEMVWRRQNQLLVASDEAPAQANKQP
jgi:hypothetical protein